MRRIRAAALLLLASVLGVVLLTSGSPISGQTPVNGQTPPPPLPRYYILYTWDAAASKWLTQVNNTAFSCSNASLSAAARRLLASSDYTTWTDAERNHALWLLLQ